MKKNPWGPAKGLFRLLFLQLDLGRVGWVCGVVGWGVGGVTLTFDKERGVFIRDDFEIFSFEGGETSTPPGIRIFILFHPVHPVPPLWFLCLNPAGGHTGSFRQNINGVPGGSQDFVTVSRLSGICVNILKTPLQGLGTQQTAPATRCGLLRLFKSLCEND